MSANSNPGSSGPQLPNGAISSDAAAAAHVAVAAQVAAAAGGEEEEEDDDLPRQTGPPLADLLAQIEDYSPTIPDTVTQYYLSTAGVHTDDPRIVKLVSLAAQKFISDLANDALQHCKMRGAGQQISKKSKDRRYVLTLEDLSLALSDQGITLKKPPYYL